MKKIIGLLLVAFLTGGIKYATAQSNTKGKISFGAQIGFNAAYYGLSDEYKQMVKEDDGLTLPIPSFHIGLFADYAVSDNFSIRPGLRYSGKGYKEKWSDDGYEEYEAGSIKESLGYIEIPINAVFKSNKILFGAGPYIGYALSGKWNTVRQDLDDDGNVQHETKDSDKIAFGSEYEGGYKRVDYGMNALLGFRITQQFSIDLGYSLGLNNIFYSGSEDYIKNRVVSVSLSYLFKK